jgi:hypothetical protein
MSFLLVGAAAVGVGAGVAKAISGGKQKKAAKAEEAKAKAEMQKQKNAFANLDTSNPYANMENTMEDLTVNQQEADFMKQQQQQSQANIMQQMKGAAGGSGIAALAQTLANQGSMDAQKSAISIGKQESQNQQLERQAASQIQNQERQGEVMSRDMERNKVSTLLGMAQSEKAAAGQKVAAADSKMWSGITGAAGSLSSGLTGMSNAGMFGGTGNTELEEETPVQMKGSPLKAADTTLVQGAYNAAIGGARQQDGMAQGMDDLMKISAENVKQIAANRKAAQQKGNDLAEGILDTGGALGASWLDATRGVVEGMHGDYKNAAAFGKKNKKAKGMQDLNTLSAEIASVKDLNTQMAQWQDDGDWVGSITEKEQGVFNAFMDDSSPKRIKNVNGKRVYEVETPEGWMTTKEIEKMAEEHKKDYGAMKDIRAQVIAANESGGARSKSGPYDPDFDLAKTTSNMNSLLKNANMRSIINDEVIPGQGTFADNLKENPEINGLTYAQLGLTPPAGDENGIIDGNESEALLAGETKDLIYDALTNPENDNYDEETTRGLVASYFSKSIENNYMDGYNKNAKSELPLDYYYNLLEN